MDFFTILDPDDSCTGRLYLMVSQKGRFSSSVRDPTDLEVNLLSGQLEQPTEGYFIVFRNFFGYYIIIEDSNTHEVHHTLTPSQICIVNQIIKAASEALKGK
jgi:hypothetical protein